MYISTCTSGLMVDSGISDIIKECVMEDSNCARSLMGKSWEEAITSETEWYTMYAEQRVVGAIMIDPYIAEYRCHHICMFKDEKDANTASLLTQLAAMLSHIRGYKPFTTVSKDTKYDYMRKFLEGCGFTSDTLGDTKVLVDIYKLPPHWKPISFDSFILRY